MAFINYLFPINFMGSIRRLPNTTFHLQRANIPALNGSSIPIPTQLNPLRAGYDMLTYNEMTWGFIVDEEMDNYMEIFDWMHGIAFPQDNKQYYEENGPDAPKSLKSDISLLIQNSSKNNIATVTFHDAFPTGLGDLNFDTTMASTIPLVVDATFSYNYYTIERY